MSEFNSKKEGKSEVKSTITFMVDHKTNTHAIIILLDDSGKTEKVKTILTTKTKRR